MTALDPAEEPKFLDGTFLWDERGYSLNGDPGLNLRTRELLRHPNPWIVIACALELAKAGDHSGVGNALDVARSASLGGIVQAALSLVGDAGTASVLAKLPEFMGPQQAAFVRVKACSAALHAGYLWLAKPMLETFLELPRERGAISLYLSWLLEERFDQIADYENFESHDDYAAAVERRVGELEEAFGSDAVVFRGRELNLTGLVDEMVAILEAPAGASVIAADFIHLRHKLEAQTGIDCSQFFRREKLNRVAALRTLSQLRESDQLAGFTPGRRYFFGHEIPDDLS